MNIYYKIFILIFLNGFNSIITQIILYKEILSQVYANEIVICFALSSWLIAGALAGVSIFPKYFARYKDDFLFSGFGLIPIFTIIISIICLLIVRNIKAILNIPVEQLMNIWDAVLITILFYGPASFFFTLSFCFGGEILKRYNGDNRLLYIIETAGAVVSGVLYTLFLNGKYSNVEFLYWLGIINIVVAYILYREKSSYALKMNIILVFIFIIYLLPLLTNLLKSIDVKSFNSPYYKYNIISKKDGSDSRSVIAEKNGVYFIFSNGHIKYQNNNTDFAEFLGWAMLSGENNKNILLVDNTYTGGINEIQKYNEVEKITAIETDPVSAELLAEIFKNKDYGNKIRFIHGDLIYFFYQIADKDKYDLVVLNSPTPDTFLNNRYYTFEFFNLLKNHLTDKGMVIFSLPGSENYMNKEIILSISSVYHTIKNLFKNIEIIPGDKMIFLATDNNITIKSETILNNMKKNNIKVSQLNKIYIEDKINKSVEIKNILNKTEIKLNKILQPSAYLYNIKRDLLMFKNNLNPVKLILIFFLFAFIIYKLINLKYKKIFVFRYFAVFLFSAMTVILELSLILIYQSFYGYLYRAIGLLYSFFMIGILIGAIILMIFNKIKFKTIVILAEILNLLILFYILNFKSIEQPVNPNIILLFIMLSGFFTGAIFNLMLENSDISIFYGADLAGGAFAGILFSLIIFPLFGFTGIIIFNLLILAIVYIGSIKNVYYPE